MKRTTVMAAILAALALTAAYVAWRADGIMGRPPVMREYIKVPEIRTVTKIRTVKVPVREVVAIEKDTAVKKLKLPEALAKDEDKQVIAAAAVAAHAGKTNVVAVLDTKTGESHLIAQKQPLPFVDFVNIGEVGVRYGATAKSGIGADIYARWDFLRIGNVYLGVYGDASPGGDAKAMVSAAYRW